MDTYNWNAEDYEKHSQSQQKWAQELIKKFDLKGTENVFDIGCGDGKVTAEKRHDKQLIRSRQFTVSLCFGSAVDLWPY